LKHWELNYAKNEINQRQEKFYKKINKKEEDLKIAGVEAIEDFTKEITEMAKNEEQSIAEVGAQGGQIWNLNHFSSPLLSLVYTILGVVVVFRFFGGVPLISTREREWRRLWLYDYSNFFGQFSVFDFSSFLFEGRDLFGFWKYFAGLKWISTTNFGWQAQIICDNERKVS